MLQEGKTKFNNPLAEEAKKKILTVVVAEKTGSFEPHQEKDVLAEALGNPEHHGHVCGMSSRKSLKTVESWASDASSHRTRQGYKERLVQQGGDEAMKDFVMGQIKDAFTSNDPKMRELRA